MPKVKNKRNKANRAHPYADGDADMGGDVGDAPAEKSIAAAPQDGAALTAAAAVEDAATSESNQKLRKRQVAEWKAMKHEVSQLKKQRQKLPKKGSKDDKKVVSKKIKKLISDMKVRHLAELKAAGLEATADDDGDGDDEDDMSDA